MTRGDPSLTYMPKNSRNTRLCTVRVGSHAWGMNHEHSDTDLFTVFVVPTMEILRGFETYNAHVTHDPDAGVDEQRHELKLWVDQLLAGNLNYLIGVFTPFVEYDPFGIRSDLQRHTAACLSKHCYYSIHGLATKNLDRLLNRDGDKSEQNHQKKMAGILRACYFGIAVLSGVPPSLDPVPLGGHDTKEVESVIERLNDAHNLSPLPERADPEAEAVFRQWLAVTRMRELWGAFRR